MNAEQKERKRAKQRECMRRLRARMTPDEVEAKRQAGRDYMRQARIDNPEAARSAERRYREANREGIAYRDFCRHQENREVANKRKAEWEKANPEQRRRTKRASAKRCAARPENREASRKRSRVRSIRAARDKAALGLRVMEAAGAVVPRSLPDHVRSGVVAMLVERVYSGDLPTKLAVEHGKAAVADYRRDVERFTLQHASLDAPIGADGASLGQLTGVY